MPRDVRLFLHEVRQACDDVLDSTRGRSLEHYLSNREMRHAIERNLMVIGEALNQAQRIDPSITDRLPELRGIVDLRNVLIHVYYKVKHDIVWASIETEVEPLRAIIDSMLNEYDEQG